jgi:hypothetical protein
MLDRAWALLEGTFTGIFDAILWLVPSVFALLLVIGIMFLPAIVFYIVDKIKELTYKVLILAVVVQIVWTVSSLMCMVKF